MRTNKMRTNKMRTNQMNKMKIIGLAGGSGSGKGEVCRIFAAYGAASIDTDKISRETARKGSKCLEELTRYFSADILDKDGGLDRRKLADIAFASKEKLGILNDITHKYILEECRDRIAGMEREGKSAVIIDAPLLFESGFNRECDIIISVIADKDIRVERIIKRDNLSFEQALRRIASQKDDDFLIRHSDYIIYNNGAVAELERQAADIYANMQARAAIN